MALDGRVLLLNQTYEPLGLNPKVKVRILLPEPATATQKGVSRKRSSA